jgi:hypothetical protein
LNYRIRIFGIRYDVSGTRYRRYNTYQYFKFTVDFNERFSLYVGYIFILINVNIQLDLRFLRRRKFKTIGVFCVVTLCSDVVGYQRFGKFGCLHRQGEVKMGAAKSFETLVSSRYISRRHKPEDTDRFEP